MFVQKNTILNIRRNTTRNRIKKSAYCEQLKPIILALRLFGLMSFTQSKKGNKT